MQVFVIYHLLYHYENSIFGACWQRPFLEMITMVLVFRSGLTFQISHPIFWNKQTTPFSKINPKKMANQGSIRFKFNVTAKENRTNLSLTI